MLKYLKVSLLLSLLGVAYADDDLNTSLLTDPHPPRLSDDLIQKSLELSPGTKWCGEDTSASNEDDLGDAEAADKCCRDHYLYCYVIEDNSEDYGLKNDNPYSVATCSCDETLLKCLSQYPNDDTANRVRWVFFGVQHPECFNWEGGKAVYADSPVRDPDLAKRIDDGEIEMPEL